MSWCPNCMTEHHTENTACSACDNELVDNMDPEYVKHHYSDMVYLTSVEDKIEAGIIESILQTERIPAMKKYKAGKNALRHYIGRSGQEIEIFVPQKELERARSYLPQDAETLSGVGISEAAGVVASDESTAFRRNRIFLLVALFLLPGAIGLLSWIFHVLLIRL